MQPKEFNCQKCQTDSTIEAFFNHCCFLSYIRAYYLDLWERPDHEAKRLGEMGVVFFSDLGHVVAEYIILQMCRLLDPPEFRRGKTVLSENLTLKYLLKSLPLTCNVKNRLNALVLRMDEICEPLREARNKIIAHFDKDTALASKTLGIVKDHSEYQEWFDLLEEVVDQMHQDSHGTPLPMVSAPGAGLDDLLMTLRDDWRVLDALRGKEPDA